VSPIATPGAAADAANASNAIAFRLPWLRRNCPAIIVFPPGPHESSDVNGRQTIARWAQGMQGKNERTVMNRVGLFSVLEVSSSGRTVPPLPPVRRRADTSVFEVNGVRRGGGLIAFDISKSQSRRHSLAGANFQLLLPVFALFPV
jgi:hypothetical protein